MNANLANHKPRLWRLFTLLCLTFLCRTLPAGHWITWGTSFGYQPELTNVVSTDQNMALKEDGTLVTWGGNYYGETNAPQNLTNVVAIASGAFHRLALKADGTVVAWGAGTTNSGVYPHYGQSIVPKGLANVVSLAAGYRHSVALRADGSVVVWGFNYYGQTNVPAELTNCVAVSSGGAEHTLALKADGQLVAWGYGYYGETNVPSGLTGIKAISASSSQSMALMSNGTVVAWGRNEYGQTNVPPGLTDVCAISAGTYSTVLRSNGTVVAWGDNSTGRTNVPWGLRSVTSIFGASAINDGSPALRSLPQDLFIHSGIYRDYYPGVGFKVDAGGAPPLSYQWLLNGTNIFGATNSNLFFDVLRIEDSGAYSVTVSNSRGTITSPAAELLVTDAPPIITQQPVGQIVSPGWNEASFIVFTTGSRPQSYQWRLNGGDIVGATGQYLMFHDIQATNAGNYDVVVSNIFGVVTSSVAPLTVLPSSIVRWARGPNTPPGLSNVLAIAAGSGHGLALKDNGTVVAWGDNYYYQTNVPAGLSNVVAVSAGSWHSLALRENGTVVAWGGSPVVSNVPTALNKVVAIAAGGSYNLALKSDGKVVSWGYDYSGATNVPVGLSNIVAIAAGYSQALALKDDGTVIGWPTNSFQPWMNVPAGLSNVVAIAQGYSHGLALKGDGAVVAWGTSYQGMGGPVTPPEGLSNVVAIAAGGYYFGDHSVALRADGTIVAWGVNDYGQTNVPPNLPNGLAVSAGGAFNLALVGTNSMVLHAIMTGADHSSGGRFSVSIPTTSGKIYRLEYKNSLADTDWIALPLVAGTGSTRTLIDPSANGSQRFYRVRQW